MSDPQDALQVQSVEVTLQVIRADGTVEEPETYVTRFDDGDGS